MSHYNSEKKFRFAIFIDGSSYGYKMIEELDKLDLYPSCIVQETRAKSIIKRINWRYKKYGWMPTLLWVFNSLQCNKKRLSDKNNKRVFCNSILLKVSSLKDKKVYQKLNQDKYDLIINTVSSIIPSELLQVAKRGVFGIHPGILPKYKGLSSIQWQIHDCVVPGFTLFKLTRVIDAGLVYIQKQIPPERKESFHHYCIRFEEAMIRELCQFCLNLSKGDLPKPLLLKSQSSRNRGLISLSGLRKFKKNWEILINSPIYHKTEKPINQEILWGSSTTAFEEWAWKVFIVLVGISQKDASKMIGWGADSDKLVNIPKTSCDLFQVPFCGIKNNTPYLSFTKMTKQPFKVFNSKLIFEFDVITAMAWMLGGFEEYIYNADKDEFGRWTEKNSILSESGFTKRPVVNEWINLIRDFLLKNKIEIAPLWPENKSYAVALTHDVDNPYYSVLFWLKKILFSSGNFKLADTKHSLLKLSSSLIISLKDSFKSKKGFTELLIKEDQLGLKSTIMVSGLQQKNDYRQTHDPLYEVMDSVITSSIREAEKKGFYIGVHASAATAPVLQRYQEQINQIEAVYGKKIISCRHHYWNVSRKDTADAFEAMSNAGIKFDSSISFYSGANFRRSIAWPFTPFHPRKNRSIDILELPSTLMDAWLGKTNSRQVLENHLAQISKQHGLAILDWHSNRFNNKLYIPQGDVYLNVLERLSKQPDVWIASLEEIGQWWEERTSKLL